MGLRPRLSLLPLLDNADRRALARLLVGTALLLWACAAAGGALGVAVAVFRLLAGV